jgi:AbrB family looped-hinge helix DNA binding protein
MKTTIEMKKRGQIVIPEAVRKALELKEGDILEINIEKYEKLQARPQAQAV